MKKLAQKFVTVAMAGLMAVGATVAVASTDLNLDAFTMKASAAESMVSSDGLYYYSGYSITGFTEKGKNEISGNFIIPTEIDGVAITRIGFDAFAGCTSITELTIPQNITFIGNGAFANCKSLKKVTYNSSYNTAYDYLYGCTGINTFEFGKGVTAIPNNACYGLSSLKKVIFNDTVTAIGSSAFKDCSSLSDDAIDLSNVQKYGGSAFEGCTSFKKIELSEDTISIGYNAFANCTNSNLTELTIPSKVTFIGNGAFANCKSLKKVTYNSNYNTAYDYLYGCTGINTFEFGKGVTAIPKNACYGLSSLKIVIIDDKINSIGVDAFNNCSCITDIYLPRMVKNDWDNVKISGDNEILASADVTFHWGEKAPGAADSENPDISNGDEKPAFSFLEIIINLFRTFIEKLFSFLK